MSGPQGLSCPGCGQPAGFTRAGGTQVFCVNDDCDVVCWDPECTPEELMAGTQYIRLEPQDREDP